MKSLKGFKGFDKDMKCQGFKYEVGKSYETPEAVLCEKGFHFCEHPLDVFDYYPPNINRFAEVEGDGSVVKQKNGDSKVCCTHINIGGELNLSAMINAAVKFVFDRPTWTKKETAAKDRGAASATGYSGAASVEGQQSIACGLGIESKAKGKKTCWLVLAEWHQVKDEWQIKEVKSAKIDGKKIKEDTWYELKKGKFVEVN